MLDQMRSAAKSWIAKLFLGLLGVSFLVWGVPSSFLPQIGGGKLFASGGSSITPTDYAYLLRNSLIRQGINRLPSAAELRQSGLADGVLLQLQFNLLLDEEVRRMQIGANEDVALQLLRQDPLFHNINGAFDRNAFLDFTINSGITQAEIIENLTKQARRDQLLRSFASQVVAPDVLYQAKLLYEREARSIDYLIIDPLIIGEIEAPTNAVLEPWFGANRSEFRAPEYRTFTYMQLNAPMLAKPQEITQERLQGYYEANKERFGVPERREFEQLRFETREAADSAYEKLQGGMNFEQVVREQGQIIEDIHRGPLARHELPALMAAEIFALRRDEISEVINDLSGPVIIRMVEIHEPEETSDIATIEQQLRDELALVEANSALRRVMREIEDARFEGATLAELAAQYGLKLITLSVDSTGQAKEGEAEENIKAFDALAVRHTLVDQIFSMQPGIDRDPLLSQNDYVWYQLDTIIPEREKEFAEVRDVAASSWIASQTQQRVIEKAQQLKAEMIEGKSLEQLAQENALNVQRMTGLHRVDAQEPFPARLSRDVIRAVFAASSNVEGKDMDLVFPQDEKDVGYLFKVTDSIEPLSTDPENLPQPQRLEIAERLSRDLIGQFVLQAMNEHAIERNQTLLQDLLSDNGLNLSR